MNECINSFSALTVGFDDALKNYNTSVDNYKRCKKSPEYLANVDERFSPCTDYFIKESKKRIIGSNETL
jgi:hypothetical protein